MDRNIDVIGISVQFEMLPKVVLILTSRARAPLFDSSICVYSHRF
jgi:hypothetical protein